ncbi:hypothetical protein J8273_3681 [Carpediemonas membranifera]|uniref:Uncharacterized protein n=1 Tax=Carpediemonas membranifera TaxID=201153 RepID=A0A8J6AUS6_9EUKA|nr:hypothetical protein J8273_3681 [Carpediemonas membranifera]|eukprot:KAG9394708.1 hypothetical protein J8273_3681 [Carpediemonas membranifera]
MVRAIQGEGEGLLVSAHVLPSNHDNLGYMFHNASRDPLGARTHSVCSLYKDSKYRVLGVADDEESYYLPPIATATPRARSQMEKRRSRPSPKVIEANYQAERQADLEDRRQRARQIRSFDPSRGEFMGADAERTERLSESRRESIKRDMHSRLPPTMAAAEGNHYNIANPTGHGPSPRPARQPTPQSHTMHSRSDPSRDPGVHGRFSVVSPAPERWVPVYERGYDIVTTKRFIGRSAKVPHLPKAPPRLSGYDFLLSESRLPDKKVFSLIR